MKNQDEFNILLEQCKSLNDRYDQGLVFIGGIAVYMHATSSKIQSMAETTHDADFYVSFADLADLRDDEDVTPNRRLNKHQFIKRGFEFDVYSERQSGLIVPYDAVIVDSEIIDGIRVASLEHLLALKLEAYLDRRGSAKGEKDERDIIRIAILNCGPLNNEMIASYLRDDHIAALSQISKSPAFAPLSNGNSQLAKRMRKDFNLAISEIQAGVLPSPS